MPVYSLGAANFIQANIEGIPGAIPNLPMEEIEFFTTPGIDGVAVRNNGAKGQPFRYRTLAYFANNAAVLTGVEVYQLFPGQVPQNLVWEGVDFDTSSVRFSVLAVGEFEIKRFSNLVVDNTIVASGCFLWATWTLLPVRF